MRATPLVFLLLLFTPAGAADEPALPTAADAIEQALRTTVTLEGDGVYGAGILIDPARGLVLTSLHVVKDMSRPQVTNREGRGGEGRVVRSEVAVDLAIVDVPALRMPGVPRPRLGDPSRLRPGDEVYAIGSPRKLPFTVSRGIVSHPSRDMEGARYVQLDMAINDGNSGGPVLTPSGEVVGITSFILRRSQGLSFALPVPYARKAFPDLLP